MDHECEPLYSPSELSNFAITSLKADICSILTCSNHCWKIIKGLWLKRQIHSHAHKPGDRGCQARLIHIPRKIRVVDVMPRHIRDFSFPPLARGVASSLAHNDNCDVVYKDPACIRVSLAVGTSWIKTHRHRQNNLTKLRSLNDSRVISVQLFSCWKALLRQTQRGDQGRL